jgi:adenylate kinase
MDEDLLNLLARQISHRRDNLLVDEHVIPHPQGCRMILPWWVGKHLPDARRVGCFQPGVWNYRRKTDNSAKRYPQLC